MPRLPASWQRAWKEAAAPDFLICGLLQGRADLSCLHMLLGRLVFSSQLACDLLCSMAALSGTVWGPGSKSAQILA